MISRINGNTRSKVIFFGKLATFGLVLICFSPILSSKTQVLKTGTEFSLGQRNSTAKVKEENSPNESSPKRNNSIGCIIPKINPWDPEIVPFVFETEPLNCKQVQEQITKVDWNQTLSLLRTRDKWGDPLICAYREFQHGQKDDTTVKLIGKWKELKQKKPVVLTADFANVFCGSEANGINYRYTWPLIVPKSSNRHLKKLGSKTPLFQNVQPDGERPELSVLIFGMDSTSRSNFIRKLPKTHEFLSKELGGFALTGYNKVAENTMPNVGGLLTGKVLDWKNGGPGKLFVAAPMFWDNVDLLFYRFGKKGYATLHAEDEPENIFNHLNKGFKYQHTTHYLRPFWLAAMRSVTFSKSERYCYSDKPTFSILLDYVKEFLIKYSPKKTFAFHWMSYLVHDMLNAVGNCDEYYLRFFQEIKPLLNHTVVFVLADHGARVHRVFGTPLGRLEDSFPYFKLVLPPWLTKKYPTMVKTLKINEERLTTAYDVHETLQDILNGDFLGNSNRKGANGISLFREITKNRTCEDAHIPEEYCPCYKEQEVDESYEGFEKAAKLLVKNLNKNLSPVSRICHEITFYKVEKVFLRHLPAKELRNENLFRLVIRTGPNNASFGALMEFSPQETSYQLKGSVERYDRYGNTSACVGTDPTLRKICYCKVN